jgi:glutamyl-tRNA synthetase
LIIKVQAREKSRVSFTIKKLGGQTNLAWQFCRIRLILGHMDPASHYRGRLAPSPTGYLHLGHARTFWRAQERARGGTLILRSEDLDAVRFKLEFVEAMIEDLRWFGIAWSEGPDVGGDFAPYHQSGRMAIYRAALNQLRAGRFVYPCACSRKDIQAAITAPHTGDDEVVYPGTCRPMGDPWQVTDDLGPEPRSGVSAGRRLLKNDTKSESGATSGITLHSARAPAWRFRVPDGEVVSFTDGNCGEQRFVAGRDFGDFVVWRGDDLPAYQLACMVDDAAMRITEVVRGADLLVSTARQLLLYRALGLPPPDFFHCELMCDERGVRLAKRHDSLSLRELRARGESPVNLRAGWGT